MSEKEMNRAADSTGFYVETPYGYLSHPFDYSDDEGYVDPVAFLASLKGITILGLERASEGDSHDSDSDMELTDIGCEHSEWFDFKVQYLWHPGWGGTTLHRIVVNSFEDIDLDKWSECYDVSYNGEAMERFILARDDASGEIFLYSTTCDMGYVENNSRIRHFNIIKKVRK